MPKKLTLGALAAALLMLGQTPAHADDRIDNVRLLGESIVAHGMDFQGTTVGGLSGIDFDPRTGDWLMISDDRSDLQPARYYRARMEVGPEGVGPVNFTDTRPLLRPDGTPYPPASEAAGTIDPEDIRFDPWSAGFWWTSEGDRPETPRPPVDPAVRASAHDGRTSADMPIPPMLRMGPDTGPRTNEALEGLTFAEHGSLVATAMEGPLMQDGESPTFEHGALSRITVQDRFGGVRGQYAYPLDEVFAQSPTGGFANNGVSAMLAVDEADPTRFLVMERSFVTGVGNSIRIYEVSTEGATNVAGMDALRPDALTPMHKRLVANLADFPGLSTVDNVEGMTWGPSLPSGERSLVLVSDDNFSPEQTTQVIAFAVR